MNPDHARAHREGDIHIHDLDFYTLTTTCCQIELRKLFKGGFSTGHGMLREPNDISSYAALACIAIQSNQNDQHGGQAIVNFDYGMADGVRKTYRAPVPPSIWPKPSICSLDRTIRRASRRPYRAEACSRESGRRAGTLASSRSRSLPRAVAAAR
ncbi:MAG: anaerobic ribonucleoside-triphosphate reductase [Christensenellales bacterium]